MSFTIGTREGPSGSLPKQALSGFHRPHLSAFSLPSQKILS